MAGSPGRLALIALLLVLDLGIGAGGEGLLVSSGEHLARWGRDSDEHPAASIGEPPTAVLEKTFRASSSNTSAPLLEAGASEPDAGEGGALPGGGAPLQGELDDDGAGGGRALPAEGDDSTGKGRAVPGEGAPLEGEVGSEDTGHASSWVVGTQAACDGKEVRFTTCKQAPCDNCVPRDCEVAAWSDWSDGDCTGLCMRQRGVKLPNNHCGMPCNRSLIETKRCETNCNQPVTCPRGTDCQWGEWTEWSACTCSCGGGQKTRDRHIKIAPQGNGKKCAEKTRSEMVPCNTHPCGQETCVDGSWGEWGDWGPCSATCGGGLQWRVRKVATEATVCGQPAEGDDRQIRYCNSQGCMGDQDCAFDVWTEWGPCSCSCDGVKHRSRRIAAYGKGNGKWCDGPTKEVAPCNVAGLLEGDGCTTDEEPVDCKFSAWGDWNHCTVTCGYGQQLRERQISIEARHFGNACKGPLKESGRCDRAPCNLTTEASAKPCIWGVWQDWSSCDKCGGQRKRFRLMLQMPEDGGAPCQPEASEETGKCPQQCDRTYCSWGNWEVGECSVTCGVGTKRRVRYLVASAQPPPDIGMFQELSRPIAGTEANLYWHEGVFLGLVGGCLFTILAQWSWHKVDTHDWARRLTGFWRGPNCSHAEEELPLCGPQLRGQGGWMPIDAIESDLD